MAATRRASASGSSGGASSSRRIGRLSERLRDLDGLRVLDALFLGGLPFLGHRGRVNAGERGLLRIHVDREARGGVDSLCGHLLDRLAHGNDRRRSLARADHQLRPVAALPAEQRRRARAGHARGGGELADRGCSRQLRPGLHRRAHHPDQVAVRRVAGAARAGTARPPGSPLSRAGRRSAVTRLTGPAPARSRDRRARRVRCGRRAVPPAQRCAPPSGSPGSAAWRPRPARHRASRRESRAPSPPSACRPGSPRAPRRSGAARWPRLPRRPHPSPAGTPAVAPPAPRARAPAARSPPSRHATDTDSQ